MLLSEYLGRGHERTLVSPASNTQHGGERHQGLARTNVTLQQSMHGQGASQVLSNLL